MAGNPRTRNGAKIIAVLGYLSAKINELNGPCSLTTSENVYRITLQWCFAGNGGMVSYN